MASNLKRSIGRRGSDDESSNEGNDKPTKRIKAERETLLYHTHHNSAEESTEYHPALETQTLIDSQATDITQVYSLPDDDLDQEYQTEDNCKNHGCGDTNDSGPSSDINHIASTSNVSQIHKTNLQNLQLKKITSIENDASAIAGMLEIGDNRDIYNRLLQKRRAPNRMEVVLEEILEGGIEQMKENVRNEAAEENGEDGADTLFQDVESIANVLKEKHPNVSCDPNQIYNLLEENSMAENRLELVFNKILESTGTGVSRSPTQNNTKVVATTPHSEVVERDTIKAVQKEDVNNANHQRPEYENKLEHNSIYDDMNTISKMFPDKDQTEIYAYLEAHHDKRNRIEIVTEELIRINEGSQENSVPPVNEDFPDSKVHPSLSSNVSFNIPSTAEEPLSDVEKGVSAIAAIIPDCDPNYLYEKLEEMFAVSDRVEKLTAELLEKKNYPKLTERLDLERKRTNRFRLQNLNLSPKEFLDMFPEPHLYFYDDEKPVSESYISHAMIQLRNEFPMLHVKYINGVFKTHKDHFAPTKYALQKCAKEYIENHHRAMRHKRYRASLRSEEAMPESSDELFYRELFYTKNEEIIKGYIESEKEAKEQRIQAAKDKGELQECSCCYDDECLFEDMDSCPEGHVFCKECIRRSTEEAVGVAKVKISCLEGECESQFSLTTLQKILNPKTFSLLLRKIQEEEIRQANIDDLESCPFCTFATIITNPDDKLFRCMNPDCLKESCRQCKEPNHIPLRCDEVEKQGETSMRAFIENRITEAMVRTCWRCKKRFYKTEGCNKMTCTCGASMCYVCRKPIKDYDHFGRGGCPQDTDVYKLHQTEMEKAAREAKQKYEEEHPELKGKDLKFDPVKHIEEFKTHLDTRGEHGYEEYDDDDDEEEEDDDDEYDNEDEDAHEDDDEYVRAVQEYMERQQNGGFP